jgi:hypothetical protein
MWPAVAESLEMPTLTQQCPLTPNKTRLVASLS